MKKILTVLLCGMLLLALTACGGAPAEDVNNDGGSTTTTTTTTSGETTTTTTTTTTASTTSTTTTTTTATTTTTQGKADIVGNVWTLEYLDVDNVVCVYTLDFSAKTLKSIFCIPWDEAFDADNWQLILQDEPESVYRYEGGEYYIDAGSTMDITFTASADDVTVEATRADGFTQTLKLTRNGNRSLKVTDDSSGYITGKSFVC